ncbi:hypothetical protein ccbrp13_21140 [Ktedonobacteria bacterium brp13]|nr:hypothetical protein ccbrp13_21140 [Ktedonobacteria bacterium brp13]
MQQNPSDVARLLELIDAEYAAAKRGLSEPAIGVSQHQFITAKMERMELLHQELRSHVGEQAMVLIAQALDTVPNEVPGETDNHNNEMHEQL